MMNFSYHHIKLQREPQGRGLMVKGEIINSSGKNCNAVVFRIVVFVRTMPVGSTTMVISGFMNGQSRTFEKRIEDLEFDKIGNDVTKIEIYPESAY
jgi:hypothetical protein